MTDPTPVHDAARERAVKLLTDGYAYDAISEEEFEWRLTQLGRAESPAAMDALVADLVLPAAVASPSGQMVAGSLVPATGRIRGIMSESRHSGPWRVPQRLRVLAVMSDMKLDLRSAVIPPGCSIEVAAIMANVSFIVAPGMSVDFDVSSVMASTRNDASVYLPEGFHLPQVRISGTAFMSEVRVRVRAPGR